MNTHKVAKNLHPGRLLILSTAQYPYNLAVIVNVVETADNEAKKMSVVVIGDGGEY